MKEVVKGVVYPVVIVIVLDGLSRVRVRVRHTHRERGDESDDDNLPSDRFDWHFVKSA